MLYLLKSGIYTKIGYSDNFQNRWRNYYNSNPTIELIGIREGSLLDERKFHIKFKPFTPIKSTEWMILPDDIFNELASQFSNSDLEEYKSIHQKKIENNWSPSEEDYISSMKEFYWNYYTLHPELKQQLIEDNREKVAALLKKQITKPVTVKEARTILQNIYNSLDIHLGIEASNIYKIWCPNEFYKKALGPNTTYLFDSYIIPTNFSITNHLNRKVKRVDSEGNVVIFPTLRAAALTSGYKSQSNIFYLLKNNKPDKNGYTFFYEITEQS